MPLSSKLTQFFCLLCTAVTSLFVLSSEPLFGYAAIGSKAPSFNTISIENRPVSLDSYRGKIVVLEWINPNSPYVNKYYSKSVMDGVGYMQTLQKRFTHSSIGVVWITIAPVAKTSSDYLTADQWKLRLVEWGASPTELILDETGAISHLYGATVTPEVCIIDKHGYVVYRGAIDSIRSEDPLDLEKVSDIHWFQSALEYAIKGKKIYTSETIPYGTRIRTAEDTPELF